MWEYRRLQISGRGLEKPKFRTVTREPRPAGQQAGGSSTTNPAMHPGLWPVTAQENPERQQCDPRHQPESCQFKKQQEPLSRGTCLIFFLTLLCFYFMLNLFLSHKFLSLQFLLGYLLLPCSLLLEFRDNLFFFNKNHLSVAGGAHVGLIRPWVL